MYAVRFTDKSFTGFVNSPWRKYKVIGNIYENPELLEQVA
jgi:hypothetical protein